MLSGVFKQLTKVTKSNKARAYMQTHAFGRSLNQRVIQSALGSFSTQHPTHNQQQEHLEEEEVSQDHISMDDFSKSMLSRDLEKTYLQNNYKVKGLQGDFASMLPDYNFDPETHALGVYNDQPFDRYSEHPLEVMVREARQNADVFSKLQDNDVLLTNFPKRHHLNTIKDIEEFLRSKVHKDLQIEKVQIVEAITTQNQTPRLAYVLVRTGSPRQARMIKTNLRGTWIQDSLLKVKLKGDAARETFNHRTVILRGFPTHLNQQQLLDIFNKDGEMGAVVGVELPTENVKIQSIKEEFNEAKYDEELSAQFHKADKQIQQSLELDNEYIYSISQNLSEEQTATMQQLLERKFRGDESQESRLAQQRLSSVVKIVTRLQAEGKQILEGKYQLLELKQRIQSADQPQTQSSVLSEGKADVSLEKQSKTLEPILNYLVLNGLENEVQGLGISDVSTSNPIANLVQLSQGELTHAYDTLIDLLEQREKTIETRLAEQVHHLGNEERILLEAKNFAKELEDVPNADNRPGRAKVEEFLSVKEQIYNVKQYKEETPVSKFVQLLQKTLNPFLGPNFNKKQLAEARTEKWDEYRALDMPDPRLSQGMNRIMRPGQPWQPEIEEQINKQVAELRGKLDIPFDELYHKEKALVQAVIEAQKAIEAKRNSLPDPLAHYDLDPKLVEFANRKGLTKIQTKSLFEQSQEKQKERISKSLGDAGDTSYKFRTSQEQELERLIDAGLLSKQDKHRLMALAREDDEQNMGYVFLTFSHADEARWMAMQTDHPFFEYEPMTIALKGKVDHGDLDDKFFMQRLRNDARLADDYAKLQTAKNELREFERDMDNQLPRQKKLKDAQNLVKDLIENEPRKTRRSKVSQRTRDEEDRLREKVKEMEKENPNADFTVIFSSDKAEQARREQHKRAFANYKAFQFLKHGIDLTKTSQVADSPKLSASKRRLQENDPYNFPELDQTVNVVLSKDIKISTLNDTGDVITKPGRRFKGYTDQEMLEAFWGKDNARRPNIDFKEDALFGYQESIRNKYKPDRYLKMPEVEFKRKKIDSLGMNFDYKYSNELEVENKQIQSYINELDGQMPDMEKQSLNYSHTHVPETSFYNDLLDLQNKIKERNREAGLPENLVDEEQYEKAVKSLEDEYGMNRPEQKDWFSELKQGISQRPVFEKDGDEFRKLKYQPQYGDFKKSFLEKSTTSIEDIDEPELGDFEPVTPEEQQKLDAERKELMEKLKIPKTWQELLNERDQGDESEFPDYQPLDKTTSRINREKVYQIKAQPGQTSSTNKRIDGHAKKEFKMTKDEYFNHVLKDTAHINEAGNKYGGKFFDSFEKGQLDPKHSILDENQSSTQQKSLSDFFGSGKQYDSDEDQDVFEEYRKKLNEEGIRDDQESPEDKAKSFRIDPSDFNTDMPRLQNYFDSLNTGVHPFDSITGQLQDKAKEQQDLNNVTEAELQVDKELYERELLGRMLDEKLTPHQFEILTGAMRSDSTLSDRQRQKQRDQFMDRRDIIRIQEEQLEKYRRQQILSGEWTEENSHEKLRQNLQEFFQDSVNSQEEYNQKRIQLAAMQNMRYIEHPESLLEKEYYFDETLGQSLKDHIDQIKQDFPGMKVQTRRDRDGFAIIKTSYKQEYKYNMEEILSADLEENRRVLLETFERLAETDFEQADGAENIYNQEAIQDYLNPLAQELQFDFDDASKLKLMKLVKERTNGKYRQNVDGFLKELNEITNEINFDVNKPLRPHTMSSYLNEDSFHDLNLDKVREEVFQDLYDDREMFRNEIRDQLQRRIRAHETNTKRIDSDFMKPKSDEVSVYGLQQSGYENAIQELEKRKTQYSEKEANKEDFDRVAYEKLKLELAQRKEAKERLLNQGLPQFKAYLRF